MEEKLDKLTKQIGMEHPFIIHLWNLFGEGRDTTLQWYLDQCK